MTQRRVSGFRATRIGAALVAVALATGGVPAAAQAQTFPGLDGLDPSSLTDLVDTGSVVDVAGAASEGGTGDGTDGTGDGSSGSGGGADGTGDGTTGSLSQGSVDKVIDAIPDKIEVGGPGFGSEGLRNAGSGEIVDGAFSVGQVLGSVAPVEALGSSGGSAAASVASSGLVPGSVYTNAVGSLGSGTIGLGSLVIPEYVIPMLGLQAAALVVADMGARQETGRLSPDELNFWHGVVEGSAQGGTMVEDAAAEAGVEVPEPLSGSIDSVQVSAEQDPHAENARIRAEAEAEAAAEVAAGETAPTAEFAAENLGY